MADDAPQDLEQVYEKYTPVLLGALAALVRQGFRLNPAEGLEVVHDFYIEALPGLFERYESSRAKFSTYLYGAFLRFARARIIRHQRWNRLLVPFDDAIAHPAVPDDSSVAETLNARVADALHALPRDLRITVDARVARGESERQIARRLRVSRYVVRQRLAEALGRIAMAIGNDETIREDLRPLAIRLWRDGHSLMRVAQEQGLSRSEARRRLHELIGSLATAARSLGSEG